MNGKHDFHVAIIKWCFTWLLACLPISFILFKQIFNGQQQEEQLFSRGEFFLVSIVMIAEPLGELLISKGAPQRSKLLLTILIVFNVANYTYMFSLTDQYNDSNKNISYVKVKSDTFSSPNADSILSNKTKVIELENNSMNNDIRDNHIKLLSIGTLIASFFIGLLSVYTAHNKE